MRMDEMRIYRNATPVYQGVSPATHRRGQVTHFLVCYVYIDGPKGDNKDYTYILKI